MTVPVDTDNLNMLKELIGDDLKEILQAYLDTAPGLIMQIEQAIQSNDAAALHSNAHSLKGSSANIGATSLPDVCLQLEQMGKAGAVNDEAASLLNQVKADNDKISSFLNEFMQQM